MAEKRLSAVSDFLRSPRGTSTAAPGERDRVEVAVESAVDENASRTGKAVTDVETPKTSANTMNGPSREESAG